MAGPRVRRLAIVAGLALLPLVVLLVRAPFQSWHPTGDVAIIALRTAEVGTSHTPLVGPFSRFGWSHPGPALFDVLAAPYHAFGNDGLLLGSLLVNGVAVFVLARTLLRTGGRAAAVVGLVFVGIAAFTLGTSWLWSPWNPTIALLPFAAFVSVAWSVSLGWCWDLPWLVGLGSFLVQVHVGYAPLVAALWLVAAIGAVRSRRQPLPARPDLSRGGRWTKPLVVSAITLVALWLAPVIDALAHDGGNLGDLLDFWTGGASTVGTTRALRLMALQLSIGSPLFGGHEPSGISGDESHAWAVPVALVLLVAALVVAWQRRDRVARNLCIVALVTDVVGVVAVSRVVGDPLYYLLYWTHVAAAMTWFAVAWTLGRAIPEHVAARVRRPAIVVAVGGSCCLVAVLAVSAARARIGSTGDERMSAALSALLPDVDRELASTHGLIEVDATSDFWSGWYRPGVMLALLQQGHDVTTTKSDAWKFGTHYASGAPPTTTVYAVPSALGIAGQEEDGAQLLGRSGPSVPLPRDAPPREPGEGSAAYVQRLVETDNRALLRLRPWWDSPFPVAVFRDRTSG